MSGIERVISDPFEKEAEKKELEFIDLKCTVESEDKVYELKIQSYSDGFNLMCDEDTIITELASYYNSIDMLEPTVNEKAKHNIEDFVEKKLIVDVTAEDIINAIKKGNKWSEEHRKKVMEEHLTIFELACKKKRNHYPYQFRNGEIVKPTGKKENLYYNPVIYGNITNYEVLRQYGDMGNVIHRITLNHQGIIYKYEGNSAEDVRDWIYSNNFGKDKKMILDFLNMTISTLRNDLSTYGILGGYRNLEDIPEPSTNKPANYISSWFKNNMGEEQLRWLKSLMLLPFHSILRKDETSQPRGLVRAPIAQGDSDCLKSFIANFYYNCFCTHHNIPLSDNRSSDSLPALRNDCHNHTGMLICDEADRLMVDWIGGGRLTFEAGNFIKRMEQLRSINVADLNNQGNNMGSLLNATPVLIWNNFISYVDVALNDRLLLCEFHKKNKPEIKEKWSLKQRKQEMLIFGEHISIAFKERYDDIKTSDTETATNIIISFLIEEFGYDLMFLKEIPLEYTNKLQDTGNIKDNIIGALRSYVTQSKIDDDKSELMNTNGASASQQLLDHPKFKSHLSYCTDDVLRIKSKSFLDWVNSKVLKGGEVSSEDINEILGWELGNYSKTKVFIVDREEIDNILDLNYEEKEG